MRGKKTSKHEEHDDFVVADMNVQGMPWYHQKEDENKNSEQDNNGREEKNSVILSKKETFLIILGAMKAGLLVGSIYLGAFTLFLLFVVYVWFR